MQPSRTHLAPYGRSCGWSGWGIDSWCVSGRKSSGVQVVGLRGWSAQGVAHEVCTFPPEAWKVSQKLAPHTIQQHLHRHGVGLGECEAGAAQTNAAHRHTLLLHTLMQHTSIRYCSTPAYATTAQTNAAHQHTLLQHTLLQHTSIRYCSTR